MDIVEEEEFEKRASKLFGGRVIKVKCWMCKRSVVTGTNERCERCKINNCLYCGNRLTKLRRLLENNEPLGDIITICENKECAMRFNIGKLKGIWREINEEEPKPDYVQ